MASKFVPAWDTRTGEKRSVPEHWFDHEDLSTNLTRTDPGIPRIAPDGVNQVGRPDDRDYATAEEIAAHEAAQGELKGQALKDALKAADLPPTGSADDQRAALVAHQEAQAEKARLAAANDGPTDSTPGDTTNAAPDADQK